MFLQGARGGGSLQARILRISGIVSTIKGSEFGVWSSLISDGKGMEVLDSVVYLVGEPMLRLFEVGNQKGFTVNHLSDHWNPGARIQFLCRGPLLIVPHAAQRPL